MRNLLLEQLEDRRLLAAVHWTDAGPDSRWSTPGNWSGGVIPASGDDVTINAGAPLVYDIDADLTLGSLSSDRSLRVSKGSLSVTGLVRIAESESLTVTGSGASFASLGATDLGGTDLFANDGGTLLVQAATEYELIGDATWQAEGTGSRLLFPNLTAVDSGDQVAQDFYINALQGGVLELPQVTELTDTETGTTAYRSIRIKADGENSRVELPMLTHFRDFGAGDVVYDDYYTFNDLFANESSRLEAVDNGTVQLGALNAIDGVYVNVDPTGAMDFSTVVSAPRSHFDIDGGTLDVSNVTTMDGTQLFVDVGAELSFSAIQSFGMIRDVTWQAQGLGSKLLFPNLTNLDTGDAAYIDAYINALQGGLIDLPKVTEIVDTDIQGNRVGRSVRIQASGEGSEVRLPELSRFADFGASSLEDDPQFTQEYSRLEVLDQGIIQMGSLTEVEGVYIHVDTTGTMDLSSLAAAPRSYFDVDGGIVDVSNVTNLDGTQIYVDSEAELSFPAIQEAELIRDVVWQSEGLGSKLVFPNLTNLDTGDAPYIDAYINALQGGLIDLPKLTEILDTDIQENLVGRSVRIQASGEGSQVRLPELSRFADFGATSLEDDPQFTQEYSRLETLDQGIIRLGSLTEVDGVYIHVDTTGAMDLSTLAAAPRSYFDVDGGTVDVSSVTNLDGTQIYVDSETELSFPAIQEIELIRDVVWQSEGLGSKLLFPNLTNLDTGDAPYIDAYINALQGGLIDLPKVTEILDTDIQENRIGRSVRILASGEGSQVRLPTLSRFADFGATSLEDDPQFTQEYSRLEALNRGTIQLGSLAEVEGVYVQVDTAGTIDLSSLTTFLKSRLAISDVNSFDLSSLTQTVESQFDINNSGINANNLSRIDGAEIFALGGSAIRSGASIVEMTNTVVQHTGDRAFQLVGNDDGATIAANKTLLISDDASFTSDSPLISDGLLRLGTQTRFDINASIDIGDLGQVTTSNTSTLAISGNWSGTTTIGTQIGGRLLLDGSGTPEVPQTFEVMSSDQGSTAMGFETSYLVGQLEISANTYVRLVDESNNASGNGPESLYVNSLIVPVGATLNLNGLNVYTRASVLQGQIENGTVQQIPDSGSIGLGSPTPGAIGTVGERDQWSFFARQNREITVVVNPGGSSVPASITPHLGFAHVEILNALGETVATSEVSAEGQTLVLDGIQIPSDGIYQVAVNAAEEQALRTGNYLISVWDSTADLETLELNRNVIGNIENPYSIDRWTFTGHQDQQLRFELVNRSDDEIVFSLSGPDDWIGFTELAENSELLNLPETGIYTLTALGTGGLTGGTYAIKLEETSRTPLALDTTYNGTFAGTGQAQIFEIDVPNPSPLLLALDDLSDVNQNEVYLRFGAPPTRSEYDFRFLDSGSDHNVIVPRAVAGTWYALVYSSSVSEPTSFTLDATTATVLLGEVTPERVSNGSESVLTVRGSGFVPGTSLLLAKEDTLYSADSSELDSYTQLTATFSAGTLPPATYDVVVSMPDGSNNRLEDAVTIVDGGGPELVTSLITPEVLGFHGTGQIVVQYENRGDAAMPAPLLDFSATQNGREGALLTLDPSRVTQGFWTSAIPEGFSNSVQFLATGATPGVLQPGESGVVTVYYAGWQQPWDFGAAFDFEVNPILATDEAPVDWDALKDAIRPDVLTIDAWDAVYGNFVANVGDTWGDYVRMLGDNANYLQRLGRTVTDVGELNSFEVQQALGYSPVPVLASSVDAFVIAPGLDIGLSRSFGTSLAVRNEIGPFGYGWVMNGYWDLLSDQRDDGTVEINGMGGYRRVFQPDSRRRNAFFALPGDYGALSSVSGRSLVLEEANGTRVRFNVDGRVESVEDTNGNRIVATYSNERLTRLTHTSSAYLDIFYNNAGRIERMLDSVGRETTFAYDEVGERLISATAFNGTVTEYSYSQDSGSQLRNALVSVTAENGVRTEYDYDSRGRLAGLGLSDGSEQINFAYDSAGTVFVTTNGSSAAPGGTGRYFHDQNGQLARIEDLLGNSTFIAYDSQSNLTSVTDSSGRSRSYAYDTEGNLTRAIDALGNETQFAYAGPFNRMTEFTDALGRVTKYAYTPEGNLASIEYPDQTTSIWTYDTLGNTSSYTNARDQAISYSYDNAGRLTQKLFPDDSTVDFEYDDRGNLFRMTDQTGVTVYEYEVVTDRLTKITFPGMQTLTFTYDSAGRRATSTNEFGYTLTYTYNDAGRLASITDSDGITQVEYFYDAQGFLERKVLGNGVYTVYQYDAAGQLVALMNHGANEEIMSSFEYTYDERGLRTSMTTTQGGWTYRYDDAGQLIGWFDPQGVRSSIVYDAAGNRVVDADGDIARAYTVNELNQYTEVAGVRFHYDADGNLIRKEDGDEITSYEYDIENRLVRIVKGVDTWENAYNGSGTRVGVTINGETTSHVVDPVGLGNVVGEYDGSGQIITKMVYGAGLLSRNDTSNSFFTFDESGSTAEITDDAGAVELQYRYSPFGTLTSTSSSADGAPLFVGEFGIIGTADLFAMRARFYDSSVGRFTQRDPIGILGGENLYAYARNSPTTFIDPTGYFPWCEIGCTSIAGTAGTSAGAFVGTVAGGAIGSKLGPKGAIVGGVVGGAVGGKAGGKAAYEWCVARYCDGDNGGAGDDGGAGGDGEKGGGDGSSQYCVDAGCTLKPFPGGGGGGTAGGGSGGSSGSVASFDPNEKTGPSGFGDENFVPANILLPYKIEFENLEDATAPAQRVDITDTLDSRFDLETFALTSVGFSDVFIPISGNPQYFRTNVDTNSNGQPIQVEIELGLDYEAREIYAQFLSIDPTTGLPPSVLNGFLPPEDGTGRGQGFFTYTIQTQSELPTGTSIDNIALITFDRNETISTDQVDPSDPSKGTDPNRRATITIDAEAPESAVNALPAVSTAESFTVSWTGTDGFEGSGVGSYDVYVSEDGEPSRMWLSGVTTTEARFEGVPGSNYQFYTVAVDRVGNREVPPAEADAQTTVTSPETIVSLLASRTGRWLKVGFSGAVSLDGPISDGSLASSVTVLNNSGDVVEMADRAFSYDSGDRELKISWSNPLPSDGYSLLIDADGFAGVEGRQLAGAFESSSFSISDMGPVEHFGDTQTMVKNADATIKEFVDINGDGELDLVLQANGIASSSLVVSLNAGTSANPDFQEPKVVQSDGSDFVLETFFSSPEIVDWDGDGVADLLTTTGTGQLQSWTGAMNGGTWSLSNPQPIEVGPEGSRSQLVLSAGSTMATGDLSGDGGTDLMIANAIGEFSLFDDRNDAGVPEFGEAIPIPLGAHPLSMSSLVDFDLGDLNGDQRPDLLVTTDDSELIYLPNYGGPLSPRFVAGWDVASLGEVPLPDQSRVSALHVADLNGDSYPDLVLGLEDGSSWHSLGMDNSVSLTSSPPVIADPGYSVVEFQVDLWDGPIWQNPDERFDVTGEGDVSPIDALMIINFIARSEDGGVPASVEITPPPFVDVNGDNRATPIDALQVINELARRTSSQFSEGEGEGLFIGTTQGSLQIAVTDFRWAAGYRSTNFSEARFADRLATDRSFADWFEASWYPKQAGIPDTSSRTQRVETIDTAFRDINDDLEAELARRLESLVGQKSAHGFG